MTITKPVNDPLRRINPYRGLIIDVPAWVEAHDYHRHQQIRHAQSMHSPGVIAGLEVTAVRRPGSNSVVVHPGAAVDENGHMIFVNEPQEFNLETGWPGITYLTLRYREVPDEILRTPGQDDPQPLYFLEAYRLEERRQLPEESYIELARVLVSGTGAAIVEPVDPQLPGADDIDRRYRRDSGPRSLGEVDFGILVLEAAAWQTAAQQPVEVETDAAESDSADDEDSEDEAGESEPQETSEETGNTEESHEHVELDHLPGMMNLIEAINATTKYHAVFRGDFTLDRELTGCQFLLLAGQEGFTLDDASEAFLKGFLDDGGVLLGEACGAITNSIEGGVEFRRSFGELAKKMGKDLAPVDRGHRLFSALHHFSGAPEGAGGPGLVLADGGMMYSDGDYGCLWDGGWPEKPASRESIRSAVELGINLGVYAAKHGCMSNLRATSKR